MSVADEGQLDPATIAELYREHADQLRRFLVGVLRDPHLAGDVLQATFAKAVEVGHTAQAESRKAWLFQVAYHEALALRRRAATGDRAIAALATNHQPTQESPDARAIAAETIATVRTALAALPTDQQQIVRMRIYEDKTFAAIAEELRIPLGTALGRMRAALEKLRQRLGGDRE